MKDPCPARRGVGRIKHSIIRAAAFAVSLFTLSMLLSACKHVPEKRTYTIFDCFDTVITLTAYTDDAEAFDRAAKEAEETFTRLHRIFDIYNRYDDISGLAEVNARAGKPVRVEPEAAELLALGKEYEHLTGGRVNIAMGAVLKLWHECRENAAADPSSAAIPSEDDLIAASRHCDIKELIVDEPAHTVMLADPNMSVDVGAIAKGYAADKAAEKLREYGFPFMLNCGGAVLTYGVKPDGNDWSAGIADPAGGDGFAAVVTVDGAALSTSGSYLRNFTVDGVSYGHIIDPATLYPPEGTASVSVLVNGIGGAALADALSTACYIMGKDEGIAFVKDVGAEALFVLPSGGIEATEGMKLREP